MTKLQKGLASRLTLQRRRLVSGRARSGSVSFGSLASKLDRASSQLAAARHGRASR